MCPLGGQNYEIFHILPNMPTGCLKIGRYWKQTVLYIIDTFLEPEKSKKYIIFSLKGVEITNKG